MKIILDFGNSTTILDDRYYHCKTSGNYLAVFCRSTGKRWVYRIIGCIRQKEGMRYRVKEASNTLRGQ